MILKSILCFNRAPISAWKTCSLGRVPSHAIVTNENASRDEKDDILSALTNAKVCIR